MKEMGCESDKTPNTIPTERKRLAKAHRKSPRLRNYRRMLSLLKGLPESQRAKVLSSIKKKSQYCQDVNRVVTRHQSRCNENTGKTTIKQHNKAMKSPINTNQNCKSSNIGGKNKSIIFNCFDSLHPSQQFSVMWGWVFLSSG